MAKEGQCVRCLTQMEEGFIGDFSSGGYALQKWNPGQPEKSFWTGTKIRAEEQIPVRTLRCPKCGYLESYADSKNIAV